jgi:hypothetical protein
MSMTPPELFLSGVRGERFEALQQALVPRAAKFTAAERDESRRMINDLVGRMPAGNRKKLGLFLAIIDGLSFLFGMAPFRKLSAETQQRVLAFLFDAPVGLLRKGFWGLNTLSKLGVYGNPGLYAEIGYEIRPNPEAR